MNMRAELKGLLSPDVDDLESFAPEDPENFAFLLQVMIAPVGSEGEESFDIDVCTLSWLAETYAPDEIVIGRHLMVVQQYNFGKLVQKIETILAQCSGENWEEVAAKLSRYGLWEFEDYKGSKPIGMEADTDLYDVIDQVADRQSMIRFLKKMEKDFLQNKDEWENVTLDRYLEATSAWLNDTKFFDNPYNSSTASNRAFWQMMAQTILAGKHYE